MNNKFVIAVVFVLAILCSGSAVAQDAGLKAKFDSLFILASSGEVYFRDSVEPAKDSIAALGEDVVPLLIDKFTTKSARERWSVIHILKRIGSPAVPYLVRALNRPDGLVVQRVCWALGDIKDSTAVTALKEVSGHKRWQVRDQAIGALGKIGHTDGAPSVLAGLTDTIGQVRKAAAVSCGKLAIEESTEQLVHLLGDDFYGARMSAMHSLLNLDTAQVVAVLADSMQSANDFVGDLACQILGKFGNETAMDLLFQEATSESPDRRAHAAVALIVGDPENQCGYHDLLFERETDPVVLLKMKSAVQANEDGQ